MRRNGGEFFDVISTNERGREQKKRKKGDRKARCEETSPWASKRRQNGKHEHVS